MAVGDRIKRARNLRGMTQKELGIAIGFEEKSADIRIAQYESNTRTPKEELLRKIAEVLDVNYRSLYEPTLYAAEDVMYTLFELDEHYPGTRLYEVTDTTDPDFPEKHMAVSFRYRLLDDFLKELMWGIPLDLNMFAVCGICAVVSMWVGVHMFRKTQDRFVLHI